MKVYEIPAGGRSLDELRRVERPDPEPGPGQVLVRVRAASLNFRDQAVVTGNYFGGAVPRDTIPLSDGAGEVVSTGRGVTGLRTGDRVASTFFLGWIDGPPAGTYSARGSPADGILAEYALLDERDAVPIPPSLSFEEAIKGLTTNITVNRSEQCSRCNGAGDIGGPVVVCSTCKGTGQVQRAGGRLRFAQECPDCGGTGRRRTPCSLCKGKGVLPKNENVKVRIPAGVDTGSRVRIPGKGEGGKLGAPPGDLFIITNVGRHQYFTRKGDNIYVTVPVTVPEAALGAKIEVPTVNGKAQLRIPPGTQSGQKFRLRSRGAPSLRDANVHGDQFVEVQVTLPKVISEETKELLRKYAQMNDENPRVVMGLE